MKEMRIIEDKIDKENLERERDKKKALDLKHRKD